MSSDATSIGADAKSTGADAAARRILDDPEVGQRAGDSATDAAERVHLEHFYSLCYLLPQPDERVEFGAGVTASGRPARGVPSVAALRRPGERSPRRMVPVALAAGLAVLLVVSMSINAVLIARGAPEPRHAVALRGAVTAPGAYGTAFEIGRRTAVLVTGLPEPARGYHYAVWAVRGDAYRRMGSLRFTGEESRLTARTRTATAHYEITIESDRTLATPEGPLMLASSPR